MVKERINVLVGKDDEHAHELGKQLMRSGAEVSYTRGNVLNIQYDVINKKPDALILSSLTRYKNELCKVLKKTEIMPMIIVINEGQGEGNEREYADLIVDKLDKGIYGKLYSRLFGISETRTYDNHRGS